MQTKHKNKDEEFKVEKTEFVNNTLKGEEKKKDTITLKKVVSLLLRYEFNKVKIKSSKNNDSKIVLKYKRFVGNIDFSSKTDAFFGNIEKIDEVVTFEGKSIIELKEEFKKAVNEYINNNRP